MYVRNKSKRLLIIGIIGCILYVIGDFLFAATGKGQTTEFVRQYTLASGDPYCDCGYKKLRR